TETVSVALSINGELIERYEHAPRKHAELLLPWVDSVLAEAGIGFSALDAIAYSRGPGSFTSLRIGIGIVQGLAWASDRPVVPVSSLTATAQSAVAEGVGSALVALDARMNEVFTGSFEVDGNGIMVPVDAERVCPPEDVRPPVNADTYGVGIGFDRYPELRGLAGGLKAVLSDTWPKASSVLQLAQAWLTTHEALPVEMAQPVYLRDNVAKKSQARI
ncbi:MAG: tRNA (adenosine(37)-N6)-threonylcarbamoyltransferase complex dimerization subunit type 1 TsaB, partial [Gammaproteobacteria bacterium]|nr:tRNA (adenosine(37)-N6)-threonylcarbamoyltransferase complex dimerization subunit type 1 TsaB [Gammaproteobacteria bacterium]